MINKLRLEEYGRNNTGTIKQKQLIIERDTKRIYVMIFEHVQSDWRVDAAVDTVSEKCSVLDIP